MRVTVLSMAKLTRPLGRCAAPAGGASQDLLVKLPDLPLERLRREVHLDVRARAPGERPAAAVAAVFDVDALITGGGEAEIDIEKGADAHLRLRFGQLLDTIEDYAEREALANGGPPVRSRSPRAERGDKAVGLMANEAAARKVADDLATLADVDVQVTRTFAEVR